MDLKNISESKTARDIIIIIGIVIIVLGILFVGINIGERRARFAGNYGNNFERNFLGSKSGMTGMMERYFGGTMPGAHGSTGEILSVNLPQIIVSGQDNLEKTVLISTSTVIRQFRENMQSSDLKAGDFVVILGDPNDQGQIDAKLIRIMPSSNVNIEK